MDFCLVAKGSVVGKAQAKDLVRLVKLVKVVIVGLLRTRRVVTRMTS